MDNSGNNRSTPEHEPPAFSEVEKSIKVIQEFAKVDSEIVETGKVRITKSVTEETIGINVPIINETFDFKHVAVPHKVLDERPQSLTQRGDTTVITVVREISVVIKKYEVIEEIHITRQLSQTPLTHEVSLRKENVRVDRISST